ncbi:MAG TPA: CDC27 family protein, partial [Vicinamibacterales bacterium]|nr:CDC27 family protein [Vicinamibacterales bacterium]
MIRVTAFVTSLMFVSVTAAQVAPPTPPAPPAPSTPVVAQPSPAPRAPRAPMTPPGVLLPEVMIPPVIVELPDLPDVPDLPTTVMPALAPLPMMIDLPQTPMTVTAPRAVPDWEIQEALRAAQDAQRIDMDAIRMAQDQAREAMRAAQIDSERIREEAMRAVRLATPFAQGVADMHFDHFEVPFAFGRSQSPDREGYDSAKRALNAREYDTAITRFDRVIGMKAEHADAALYWKAFAQFKLGRMDDALATIQQLRRDHAQSRYITDAKVLEADARRMSGQNVNPATLDDDEIKLLAIQGIQNTEPERAIPLLEGVLNATNSLRVKQQALYVLALSDRPQAHQILMKYAKGGGTPDLQRVAISYIASRRDKQTTSADLNEIYTSTQDPAVR